MENILGEEVNEENHQNCFSTRKVELVDGINPV